MSLVSGKTSFLVHGFSLCVKYTTQWSALRHGAGWGVRSPDALMGQVLLCSHFCVSLVQWLQNIGCQSPLAGGLGWQPRCVWGLLWQWTYQGWGGSAGLALAGSVWLGWGPELLGDARVEIFQSAAWSFQMHFFECHWQDEVQNLLSINNCRSSTPLFCLWKGMTEKLKAVVGNLVKPKKKEIILPKWWRLITGEFNLCQVLN